MKRWICILLLGLVQGLWAFPALAQDVNASVDRDTVAENETLRLVIEVSGSGPTSDPDLSPLSQDFQVLGTAKSDQFNMINGTIDAKTRWTVTLAPQKTGSLTIPALTVGDQQTQPIVIKVTEAGTASSTGATSDIFIESEIKPDTAYVQQQLTYVLRIYYAVTPHGPQLSDPKAADALIERLGDDRQYTTQRGDRRYGVIERQYAIFPQSSGALSIESPIFTAQVPDTRQQSANNHFLGQGGFLAVPNRPPGTSSWSAVPDHGEAASTKIRYGGLVASAKSDGHRVLVARSTDFSGGRTGHPHLEPEGPGIDRCSASRVAVAVISGFETLSRSLSD